MNYVKRIKLHDLFVWILILIISTTTFRDNMHFSYAAEPESIVTEESVQVISEPEIAMESDEPVTIETEISESVIIEPETTGLEITNPEITAFEVAEQDVVRSAAELKQAILNAAPGDVILVDSFEFESSIGFQDKNIDVTLRSYNGNPVTLTLKSTISPYYLQFLRGDVTLNFDNVILDGTGAKASLSFNLTDSPTGPSRRNDLLTINNGVFQNFGGQNNGGALHSESGCIMLNNCTLTNNYTATNKFGGAMYLANGDVIINSSQFNGNSSGMSAGAIYVNGNAKVYNSSFENNSCGQTGYGGAISAGGTVDVEGSVFANNTAGSNGGGISASDTASIVGSTFTDNRAGTNGGALDLNGKTVIIQDCIFENNSISSTESDQEDLSDRYAGYGFEGYLIGGGAINLTVYEWSADYTNVSLGQGDMTIDNTQFISNSGLNGGAVFIQSSGSATVNNSTFDNNEAFADGGGIFTVSLGNLAADSTTVFQKNTASEQAVWTVDVINDETPFSAMHEANILTKIYSSSFTNAYNNFDINMVGSEAPPINSVNTTNVTVTGSGKAGSKIKVIFPDGSKAIAIVDEDGNWTVDVPSNITLANGDIIYAIQTEEERPESVKTNTIVVGDPKATPTITPTSTPINTSPSTTQATTPPPTSTVTSPPSKQYTTQSPSSTAAITSTMPPSIPPDDIPETTQPDDTPPALLYTEAPTIVLPPAGISGIDNIGAVQNGVTGVTNTIVIDRTDPAAAQIVVPPIKNYDTDVTEVYENVAYYYDFPDDLVPLGYAKIQMDDEEGNTFWMILQEDNIPLGYMDIKTNPPTNDGTANLADLVFLLSMTAALLAFVIRKLYATINCGR